MSPLLQLFVYWITVSAGLISIGHNVDQWMSEDARRKFADDVRTRLNPDWMHWSRSVNRAFLTFFDAVYRRRFQALERALWQSVLFSYAILFLARVVLKVFRIPVPETPAILGVALVIAIGGTLFVQAFRMGGDLLVRQHLAPVLAREVIRTAEFWRIVVYGSSALSIYTATSILTGQGVGVSARTVTAISLGAAIGVPLMLLITVIPERVLPVSPFSAVASSVLAVSLLALLFPGPAKAFVEDFTRQHWKAACLVLFTLFADMVSLVETRWVLMLSGRRSSVLGVLSMLVVDLVLSAGLFFVLPGIVDQDFEVLRGGIMFSGSQPWIGILFWSTFATSMLFYVFVAAVVALRAVVPVLAAARVIDKWFPLYDHPVRLISITMVLVSSFGFAAVLIGQYLVK
jgi:hypothetical protein